MMSAKLQKSFGKSEKQPADLSAFTDFLNFSVCSDKSAGEKCNTQLTIDCFSCCLLIGWIDDLPDAGSERTTYQRTYDEHPEVGKSLTTLEQSGTN
jgi:hypothetical protein